MTVTLHVVAYYQMDLRTCSRAEKRWSSPHSSSAGFSTGWSPPSVCSRHSLCSANTTT